MSKAAKKKEKRERAREQAIDSRLRKQGKHAEAQARKIRRAAGAGQPGRWTHP